jgi:ATP phosphoribosyltransferase regulatory subunit
MNDALERALLPAGLHDELPPDADHEATAVQRLIDSFAGYGYRRVKPPLIEFEESLLTGGGGATADQMFRLMDPVSQRMMGVRPDITVQVGRIATTRLAKAARPLRLSYAGQVLRVRGSQLRPERQFTQVGLELIGAPGPRADAEVVAAAAEALAELGIEGLSVDLGLPTLVPAICDALDLGREAQKRLRLALDRKDAAAVAALGGAMADLFGTLLAAAGPAERALESLGALDLAGAAAAEREALMEVARLLRASAPGLTLTIDPVENRGYEYHTGVTFTFFALGVRGELGRGGRYGAGTEGESATGVTLFMDTIMRGLPRPLAPRRVLVPADSPEETAAALRRQGWATVRDLADGAGTPEERAAAQDCSHVLDRDRNEPRPLGGQ